MRRKFFIKQPLSLALLLAALTIGAHSQATCNNGQGRVFYERLPNQQLQGFDDDVVRDTAHPFRTLEKCQDLCLRDRTASNNLVRACSSFDFQPGSRIAAYGGNTEYEESTCYLTREQATPEGIGNLMLVPNSIHFNEVCLTSNRPERECPSRRYVFERYPRKKLKLPVSDVKEITAANRTDCEDKCLNEFSFVCRSANFDSTLRSCSLSRFTRRTHPELLEDDPNSDYLENTCLTPDRRCDGLIVFVKEANKKLGGPFEVEIFNASSLEECQAMCLRAEKYFCRAVEFDEESRQCVILEEDSVSQKDDLTISSDYHHFYDLACLDNQRNTEYPDNSVTSHLFDGISGRRPDTAFQRYRNSRLGGEFHSEITGRSLSECLDECLRQTSFQCRSAVYSDRLRTCRLSRYNQKDSKRIIYDADYDYYENLMLGNDKDMGSTRPDTDWGSTHSDRDNQMPGKYPYNGGGMYPGDRYPTSPIPGGGPYDRYNPNMIPGGYDRDRDKYGPMPGDQYDRDRDRYPNMMPGAYDRERDKYGPMMPGSYDRDRDGYPNMMPGAYDRDRDRDRYPSMMPGDKYGPMMPGAYDRDRDRYGPMMPGGAYDRDRYGPLMPGDKYGPMMPGAYDRDRYPQMGPDRYPMSPDRYPQMSPDRYPMSPDRYPQMGPERYPMSPPDRYPPIGSDKYPPMRPVDRYPPPSSSDRYPPPTSSDRYPPSAVRPPVTDPIDTKYPPNSVNPNQYPDNSRSPELGLYPDTRYPPMRGQVDPNSMFSGRYPEMPPGMMPPSYGRYPASDNRFPVGNDRFPINIYKYGNRPMYMQPGMSYPPYENSNRGYAQPQQPIRGGSRPPYIMVGFGDSDNSVSDMYGMPYGAGRPPPPPPFMSGTRCDEADSYKQMGLRQKMRNQFVRKKLRASNLIQCQRECSNAKDFICRSFNFRDDGERDRPPQQQQPQQPSVESFNCELSDRDTRELDVNNPQMFENGNYDFYERSIGGRSMDGECLDVSQVCNEDGMEFTLRTSEAFAGRIYSYGFYDRCFFRGNGGTVNVLRISGPQGYPECGTQRFGDTMTNIIVIQFSEHLQTSRDKRFNLTCLFRGPGESVVTSGYIGAGSGSPVPIEYLPAENSMSSKVRLMILYQGRPTTTIAVGDPLTFKLESQDGYSHISDIFATNVVARDPYSGRSVQLIDRYGCPVDTFVFPELGRSRDGDSLEARFNAFKIPESNFLVFEATVRTCRDGCQPAYCNSLAGRSEPSFGRRKRSLNETEEAAAFVNVTISSEDDTKKNETVVSNVPEENSNKDADYPEQVREMIEVFESREEMNQETIAKKMIALDTESVCLSVAEYYGLVISTMMLLALLMTVAVIVGLLYKKYWKIILKNTSYDSYHSNTNSFTNHSLGREKNHAQNFGTHNKSKVNNDEFNEAYRSSSTVSIFGAGLQKTFATGNLSRICQIPVINPINKSNGSSRNFDDDSEPIYTDPSLFERSRI